MTLHRVLLVAVAALFSAGMTSVASANCCGWGYSAPIAYAAQADFGCGGCGAPTAAVVYAQPVAPAPIAVSSCCGVSRGLFTSYGWYGWSGWGSGWGVGRGWGCGNCGCYACGQVAYAAPALYIVNQGPAYTGPGLMTYPTYSPETAYVPATDYPYTPGYCYRSGYGYGSRAFYPRYYARPFVHAHYAYRAPFAHPYVHPYMHPHYWGAPRWRHYP